MKKILIPLTLSLLASCSLGPDYKKPVIEFSKRTVNIELKSNAWWQEFNDPILNNLIDKSLKANSDILISMSNVNKAQENLNLSQANILPQINLQSSNTRTLNSDQTAASNAGTITNSLNLAAVLNYEIDLWGAVSKANEASKALLLAAESNKDAISLTISSNVAIAYFNLLSLKEQYWLNSELIHLQEEIFKLNKFLVTEGVSNELVLSQIESDLIVSKSALPPILQSIKEQETSLQLLINANPRELIEEKIEISDNFNLIPVPPILPEIINSKLLENRPDIIAAEQNLIAANANIAIARAEYFPQVSLSAQVGKASNLLNTLFTGSAKTWQVGAGLTAPILDFGRIKANVNIAKENEKQLLITYQNTIQTAFSETINFLKAQETSKESYDFAAKNDQALAKSLYLTEIKHKNGNVSQIDVLSAKQNLLKSKITLVNAKLARLNAAVNLFKSIGGSI